MRVTVDTKYDDDIEGLRIIVNGKSPINFLHTGFDAGNSAMLVISLHEILEWTYRQGFDDGDRKARAKGTAYIQWLETGTAEGGE